MVEDQALVDEDGGDGAGDVERHEGQGESGGEDLLGGLGVESDVGLGVRGDVAGGVERSGHGDDAAEQAGQVRFGGEGSEAMRLARGLLEDTGVRIAYRQTEASLPLTRDMFGLTDVQTQLLQYLRKGSAMWRLGGRTFVVQHLLSSIEEPLVQTDSRMRAVAGVDDLADEDWERLLDDAMGASA